MTAAPTSPDALFREHERFLWGLSYRMTGSAADADDVVQETFARALATPPRRTGEPWRPWLTRVALNLARDVLRRRKRDGYVGPWLPSPVESSRLAEADDAPSPGPPADARYERLESVTFAFLLALEALSPRERAVLLLRDVFDYSVRETAELLEIGEPNVKTTHHRARRALSGYDATRATSKTRAKLAGAALQSFLSALAAGDGAALEVTLAESVRARTDAGGEFLAARNEVRGRSNVARFYLGVARKYASARNAVLVDVNGTLALLTELTPMAPRAAPRTLLAVDVDDLGLITRIYNVFATRKLTALPRHDG